MLLTCRNISKSFDGVHALSGIDWNLASGEAQGLVGANGAGKSTLMKILAGAITDHEGTMTLDGQPLDLASPHESLARGIAMVYQELSGIAQLSVAENLFLGRQPVGRLGLLDWRTMRNRAREILEKVGLDLDVARRLGEFSLSVRQLIEIARCLDAGSRIFILDEPTSALSPPEKERLFQLIRRLRDEGKSVVLVSHFIEDVLEICDRVTILADGRVRSTRRCADTTKHEIIQAMLEGGESAIEAASESKIKLPKHSDRAAILEARGLGLDGCFSEIDLSLRQGECLGLYGFAGAGHQELAHALAGSTPSDAGHILWDGNPTAITSPADALKLEIAFVAADRSLTLVTRAEIFKNLTLTHLKTAIGSWLLRKRETNVAQEVIERVGCRPADPCLPVGALSGGNQQKIALGKWLLGPVRVLILDEPTRGIDVGAKGEIMELIRKLKEQGTAVLLASCEPELLLGHADRILVLRRGTITKEFSDCAVDKAELMRYA